MKKIIPYLIFVAAYIVLMLVVGAAINEVFNQMANQVLGLLVPVAIATIAILAARRAGCLSTLGVLIVTVFSALGIYMVIIGIFSSLITPVGGSVPLLSLARLGGWSFALSNLIYVVAPLLWLQFLKN